MFAPTALMKAFLEHCTHHDYQTALIGESYMTISVSNSVGERDSSEYLYRAINILGGAELGRISIGGRDLSFLNTDEQIKEAIERNVEDFYRLVRQGRRPFMSSEAYMYRSYFNDNINTSSTVLKPVYTQPSPIYAQESPKPSLQPKAITPYEQDIIDTTKQDFEDIKALLDSIRNKASDTPKDNITQSSSYMPKDNTIQSSSYMPKDNTIQSSSYMPKDNTIQSSPYTPKDNTIQSSSYTPSNNFETPLQSLQHPSQVDNSKIEAFQSQYDSFAQKQQEDIKDITKIFSQKNSEEINIPVNNNVTYQRPLPNQEVVYREKTCKQMLLSLPHYFQSQLAVGINVIFQFNITGDETVEGYLTIANSETSFTEGIAPKADVSIFTTSSVMKDILKGKYTSQKAFMTGQLKVRGNFVLLNKLDQLYKKMP